MRIVFLFSLLSLGLIPGTSRAQSGTPLTVHHVGGAVFFLEGATDNIGVSVGADGVVLVDAGYVETSEKLRAALASLRGGEPAFLFNTHWHHAFANEVFGPETRIVAHENVRDRLQRANFMFNRNVPPRPPAAWPSVTFKDSLSLHFNGEEITLTHLPGAHTDGDVVVIFRGSNVVLTGDVFVPHLPWIDYASGGSLKGLLSAADALLEMIPKDAKIIPGHGRVCTYDDLKAFREMLTECVAFVESRVKSGKSLAEIQVEGIPERWKSWASAVPESLFIEGLYRDLSGAVPTDTAQRRYEFINGCWFDGKTFVPRNFYSVNGLLTTVKPPKVDDTIDLKDKYVVPPFGEAHNHNLSDPALLDDDIRMYLSRGVFYAMIQDPAIELGPSILDKVNKASSVDVSYTQGVVTPSWGVIPDFYKTMAERGRFGNKKTLAALDKNVLFLIDEKKDLDEKWPLIKAKNSNFIKVILGFSEELVRRRNNPQYPAKLPNSSAKPGLDPQLLPLIVRRAHAAGLRVSAHIETAADFHVAVTSGVDITAHLPGSWQIGEATGFTDGSLAHWMISESDARLAAKRKTIVITTTFKDKKNPDYDKFAQVHRHNLALLAKWGVPIALGSDYYGGTIRAEVLNLADLKVFDNLTLLKLLSEKTPQIIFPKRKIGELREGFEASFLVLEGNPVKDLSKMDRIVMRVKQGQLMPAIF